MKKLGLILASIALSAAAVADEAKTDAQPMTFAATNAGVNMEWELPQHNTEREPRALQDLEYRARTLNSKIEEQLDKRLDEKFSRQLHQDF